MKKSNLFIALLVCITLSNQLLSQTTNYNGTGTTLAGSVWSSVPEGPFTGGLNSTGGAILVFNSENLTLTGANLRIKGIVANANTVFTTGVGTIQCFEDGFLTVDVNSGVLLDIAVQGFMNKVTNGYIKNGEGVFALAGNSTNAGGVTLNAGTIITKGPNALGGGVASNVLTLNGGTLAVDAFNRDFTSKLLRTDIRGNITFGELLYGDKNLTLGAVTLGSSTRIITIGGTALYEIKGIISGDAGVGLTLSSAAMPEGKTAGVLIVSGANTYSGATTINPGRLRLGASGAIPDASNVVLNGGTFQTGTTGFTETAGMLTLLKNSTITLGTGVHTLTFANSSTETWTAEKVLTINGWTGTAGESGTAGKIFVGADANGLTTEQLSQISFTGYTNGTKLLATGELVPKSATTGINSKTSNISAKLNNGNIKISGLNEISELNVYNANGQLVKSMYVDNGVCPVQLNSGLYILKIADKVFKVIK